MTSVRTQINCPQCGQQIVAEIQQIFDAGQDPQDKQRLLSGQFNLANCPHCGFHGNLSSVLVYHDPEKELLLTFTPPGINLPRDEQEKQIGRLINQVTEALPQEQRKGYLFSPQAVLTMQGLVERILEEDGVTREMLDKQKERMSLLQRLAAISDDEALAIVIEEEDEHIDEDFFRLISQLVEASMAQGDQQSAQALSGLQQRLLPITTVGKQLQAQSQEIQDAIETLQAEGQGLTRERLLELILEASSEMRIDAYVSLARGGIDYEFYQLLSGQIEAAKGDEKARLEGIRDHLLVVTQEIDDAMAQRLEIAKQNVETLLGAEDVQSAIMQNLPAIDEFFMQALELRYQEAKGNNDLETVTKIEAAISTIQQLSESAQAEQGPDPEFVQSLIDADEETRTQIMQDNPDKIDEKLVETLTGLLMQLEQSEQPEMKEMAEKVRAVYRAAVRMSMSANMGKSE